MRFQRFHIQGFRSLRDIEFAPGDLSVLVGPNNSGKSNIVAAIDLLEDIYGQEPQRALARRGGFEAVSFRHPNGMREDKLGFAFTASVTLNELTRGAPIPASNQPTDNATVRPSSIEVHHEFSVTPGSFDDLEGLTVDDEHATVTAIWADRRRLLATFDRKHWRSPVIDGRAAAEIDDELFQKLFGAPRTKVGLNELFQSESQGLAPRDLAFPRIALLTPVIQVILDAVRQVRLYHLSPIESRRSGPLSSGGQMFSSGDNLPALVGFLQSRYPGNWSAVLRTMSRIVPSLEDVQVEDEYDETRTLRFYESDSLRPWSSRDISDGTIQSLAAIAAVFDPRSPLDLIEEPENSLHPWAIRGFIDACREATASLLTKQIVLTTHSPVLLDYVRPGDVFVVWRANGETYLQRLDVLDPDAQRLWEHGDTTLSDLVDSGWVREGIPGGVA
jgi:predicted ATPase